MTSVLIVVLLETATTVALVVGAVLTASGSPIRGTCIILASGVGLFATKMLERR